MKPKSIGRGFKTKDSALSYYVNQLDALDTRLYQPLTNVTWSRDIKLRTGISMGNETVSYVRSQFAASGTLNNSNNMSWISAETTAIPGITINGERIVSPMRLMAREVSFTSVELDRSQLLGQPIDAAKTDALNLVYQMNTDQMVYIGDTAVGATGLVNAAGVVVDALPVGAGGSTTWALKTPIEILKDLNAEIQLTWAASGYTVFPGKILLPPAQYGYLAATMTNTTANMSILNFLLQNNIAALGGSPLEIAPSKWLIGAGAGGLDRMVLYTNDEGRIRFPMVPIRRETAYYFGIRFTAPYLWAYGQVEIPYPETIRYADGL